MNGSPNPFKNNIHKNQITMETTNTRNLDYNFIAVPTNLFFALDNNLRTALTVLLQLSSVFADQDGFFFRTNEDLQQDLKMGKNLTIAVLESLYQYNLLEVKSVGFTKKNGKKQVNFFRVCTENFKEYEQYHIYTITKNVELHINTVDYKAKNFKVTYTADTAQNDETAILAPSDVQNDLDGEIPTPTTENGLEGQEMAKPATFEESAPTEDDGEDVIDVDEETELQEVEDDITKKLSTSELETLLLDYYDQHKDTIHTEAEYKEFEIVYNMVLQNYKDNNQITFEQYNQARLFTVLPKLSSLRYKILTQTPKIETRSFRQATSTKTIENSDLQKTLKEENAILVNPIGFEISKEENKIEDEDLKRKCLQRMKVLYSKAKENRDALKAYNTIVDGLKILNESQKISNLTFNQLKEKAWFCCTDTLNTLK